MEVPHAGQVDVRNPKGGIEKDEWGHWSRSMKRVNGVAGHIEKGQVRRGLGCGSDRGVAVGQTGACLTGF